MDGIIRQDDTPQHKAVREAFTNMIIHGDLMMNGLLRVEKFDDKFVLTNPGLLKLPIEQIYLGGESKARNQRMQNMLRMIGYGENLGSGFPLILSAWNEKHWLKPELIEQSELMQVKLVLHIETITNDPKADPKADPKVDPKTLSVRQREIVNLISTDQSLTRENLAQSLKVSDSTIKRELMVLKEMGVIERDGGKTYGKWIIKMKN